MRQINIAMVLVKQGDSYLLQLRKGPAVIGAANLIGAFGGKINEAEQPVEAACRELNEETTLLVEPKDLKELGGVEVESDYKHQPVEVVSYVFEHELDEKVKVEADEGELVKMDHHQIQKNKAKLTPATRAAFKELVGWL